MLSAGSVNIMRFGAGPNGVMRTLGQYMLGSGATFGYFGVLQYSFKLLISCIASLCPLGPQSAKIQRPRTLPKHSHDLEGNQSLCHGTHIGIVQRSDSTFGCHGMEFTIFQAVQDV